VFDTFECLNEIEDKFGKELFESMLGIAWCNEEILLVAMFVLWQEIFDISTNCFFTVGLVTIVYDLQNNNYLILFNIIIL